MTGLNTGTYIQGHIQAGAYMQNANTLSTHFVNQRMGACRLRDMHALML